MHTGIKLDIHPLHYGGVSMTRFDKFSSTLASSLPGFEVKYKDESIFMKILGKLLFFNKDFMTRYATTIGNTVYFPSREFVESNQLSSIVTMAHEYRHARDSKKITKVLFSIAYLLPQLLAPFMLFFGFISWWLAILLMLLFLAPLPAYFRKTIELRGYIMSLFMYNEIQKEFGFSEPVRKELLLSSANKKDIMFTGPSYYFMWPFGSEDLVEKVDDILSEKILSEDDIYSFVAKAFADSK